MAMLNNQRVYIIYYYKWPTYPDHPRFQGNPTCSTPPGGPTFEGGRFECRLLDCYCLMMIWLVHLFLMVTLWWTNIAMENHHAINGKIHDFYGHFPLLFVGSPEGSVNIVCLCSLWYHQPISRYCCHHFGWFLWFVLIYFVVPFNGPSSSKRTKKGQSWFTPSQADLHLRLIMEKWEILQSWGVKLMKNRDWKNSWWYRPESLQLWTKLLGPIFQVPCWKLHVHMKGWPCGWLAFFATFSGTWTRKKQVYHGVSNSESWKFPTKISKNVYCKTCANHAVKNQPKKTSHHRCQVRCRKIYPQVGIVQWPRYFFTVPPRKWWVMPRLC